MVCTQRVAELEGALGESRDHVTLLQDALRQKVDELHGLRQDAQRASEALAALEGASPIEVETPCDHVKTKEAKAVSGERLVHVSSQDLRDTFDSKISDVYKDLRGHDAYRQIWAGTDSEKALDASHAEHLRSDETSVREVGDTTSTSDGMVADPTAAPSGVHLASKVAVASDTMATGRPTLPQSLAKVVPSAGTPLGGVSPKMRPPRIRGARSPVRPSCTRAPVQTPPPRSQPKRFSSTTPRANTPTTPTPRWRDVAAPVRSEGSSGMSPKWQTTYQTHFAPQSRAGCS